jgi:hypothetical protein
MSSTDVTVQLDPNVNGSHSLFPQSSKSCYPQTIPYTLPIMADKVKETALEEAERIKTLAKDAYQSYAYIYPIKVRMHVLLLWIVLLGLRLTVIFGTGYLLLPCPQGPVEAAVGEACTYHHHRNWCNNIHVPRYIRASSCCSFHRERASRDCYYYLVGPE